MKQIDEVVKQYLEMETNFSIMISGSWGSGKTYYFKNQIFDLIKGINVFHDHSKKYKPIIISLFGIKNIDELQALLQQMRALVANNRRSAKKPMTKAWYYQGDNLINMN